MEVPRHILSDCPPALVASVPRSSTPDPNLQHRCEFATTTPEVLLIQDGVVVVVRRFVSTPKAGQRVEIPTPRRSRGSSRAVQHALSKPRQILHLLQGTRRAASSDGNETVAQ